MYHANIHMELQETQQWEKKKCKVISKPAKTTNTDSAALVLKTDTQSKGEQADPAQCRHIEEMMFLKVPGSFQGTRTSGEQMAGKPDVHVDT